MNMTRIRRALTYGKFDADENVEKLCETRQMARYFDDRRKK